MTNNHNFRPSWNSRTDMRWIEKPSDVGLRFAGYADELAGLKHTGWFTDEFCDEKVRGVVYHLPSGRLVIGIDNDMNGEANQGGPALIEMETHWARLGPDIHDESLALRDAAMSADSLAEGYAETEREYQSVCRLIYDAHDAMWSAIQERADIAGHPHPCEKCLQRADDRVTAYTVELEQALNNHLSIKLEDVI